MKTSCFLELAAPPDPELRGLLLQIGARLESALTGWALPDDGSRQALEAELQRRGVPYDFYFDFVPSAADHPENLAAYLPLTALNDAAPAEAGELVLLRDEEHSTTVASENLIDLLPEVTTGLGWEPIAQRPRIKRLVNALDLPEPVVVPSAVFQSQADDGTWAVRSDGRELLTPTNLKLVRQGGMVRAPQCQIADRVLTWRRPMVFSGLVLQFLEGRSIRGIAGAPVYLGTEVA